MTESPNILVVGAGSAGKRHAQNLRNLGCRLSLVDPRQDRLEEASCQGATVGSFTDLRAALDGSEFDGFVIASPPALHVPQAIAILERQRRWVLCEKPLGVTAVDARRLEAFSDRILLGYTYRWWPPIQAFRRKLLSEAIGRLRGMRFVMSAHLADWHPWENYQGFFMANRELGGGALLDESHFIDLMLWMHAGPSKIYAQVEKVSDLDIETDDNVEAVVSFPDGVRVNMHLDLIGRPHERSILAVGDKGTLVYSYEENAVKVSGEQKSVWNIERYDCERNEMFVRVGQEFLALVKGSTASPSCSVRDGIAALEVVDACRESSRSGKAVLLDG